MDSVTFLLVYLATFLVLTVVLILGQLPGFEDSVFARVSDTVSRVPEQFFRFFARVFGGQRGEQGFNRLVRYCSEEANPILQIAYVLLIVGGCYAVYGGILPKSSRFPELRFVESCFVSMIIIAILLFFWCWRSDPGVITRENIQKYQHMYKYDEIVHTRKQDAQLRCDRPARSKRSAVTRRLIARFDHYCGWIGNDVGLGNHRVFLLFLLWHIIVATFAGCAALATIYLTLREYEILSSVYAGDDGKYHPVTWVMVVRWCLRRMTSVCATALGLLIIAAVLAVMLIYHLKIVLTNVTTYEEYKRAALLAGLREEIAAGKMPDDKSIKEWVRRGALPNAYSRGAWKNLLETLRAHP